MGASLDRSRILLTGVTGYIGSHLARALVGQGAEVHGLSRECADRSRLQGTEVNVHEGDLLDGSAVREVLARARPTHVFHGAVVRPGPGRSDADVVEENLAGTRHLLAAAVEAGVERLVMAGSATEYGPGRSPFREDDPSTPETPYGASKAAASALGLKVHGEGRLEVTVLRFFYVYGLDERPNRLVPRAIRAGLAGRPLPLTGPGLRRDFVFIDDAVDACLRGLDPGRPSGQVVNVGSGVDTANEEVVELLGDLLGRPIEVAAGRLPTRTTDRESWRADVTRAARVLGWSATTDLRQGLLRSLQWHREQGEAPR